MLRAMLIHLPGWSYSLLAHLCLLVGLAWWLLPGELPQNLLMLDATKSEPPVEFEELAVFDAYDGRRKMDRYLVGYWVAEPALSPAELVAEIMGPQKRTITCGPTWIDPEPEKIEAFLYEQLGTLKVTRGNRNPRQIEPDSGRRVRLFRRRGISPASEQAVALALKWLAAHQLPDGGWDFDHTHGPGVRSRLNPGETKRRNAATALALLPFLGVGQTHREGDYTKVVEAGLGYLVRNVKMNEQGGDLTNEGGAYAQALGAVVLCEAYGMTRDGALAKSAQAALNWIAATQDPTTGGWKPETAEPVLFAWNLLAVKAGYLTYLNVPPDTARKAKAHLDSILADAVLMDRKQAAEIALPDLAVSLLCELHLGRPPTETTIERRIQRLCKQGPSKSDLETDYLATQALFHATGGDVENDRWHQWNSELSNFLVNSQGKQGTETGSWYFPDDARNKAGGRMYCTALGCMILEVYYRHMPLYGKQSLDDDSFPD